MKKYIGFSIFILVTCLAGCNTQKPDIIKNKDTSANETSFQSDSKKTVYTMIRTLELNTEYQLDIGEDEKENFLLVSTDIAMEDIGGDMAKIILNDKQLKVELPEYPISIHLLQSNNKIHRLLLWGGIGNDYGGIFIYDLDVKGIMKLDMIPGFIEKIDFENGELLIRDRKQLLGLQFMEAYYSICEDGNLIPNGNFRIDTALTPMGFTLTKEMRVFLYDSDIQEYKKSNLRAGERLKCYGTDMKNKIFFLLEDNTEGYIDMVPDEEGGDFSIDDVKLVDYFDKSEFQWAG